MEFTKGEWRIERDAQGACMIMHPTEKGKAIALLTEHFSPNRGMVYPKGEMEAYELSKVGIKPYAEREANANLIASAPIMHGQLTTGKEALIEALNALNSRRRGDAKDYLKGVIAGNEMAIARAEGKDEG